MRNVSSCLTIRGCTLAMGNGWQRGQAPRGDRHQMHLQRTRREIFDIRPVSRPTLTLLAFGVQASTALLDLEWTPVDILPRNHSICAVCRPASTPVKKRCGGLHAKRQQCEVWAAKQVE